MEALRAATGMASSAAAALAGSPRRRSARPSSRRASIAPDQSCVAWVSSASAPSKLPLRVSAPASRTRARARSAGPRSSTRSLARRARSAGSAAGSPAFSSSAARSRAAAALPGSFASTPSSAARATLSSPLRTATAARSRAERGVPGRAASSRSRNARARTGSPRWSDARASRKRVSGSGLAGRTFSSAATAGLTSSPEASAAARRDSFVAGASGSEAASVDASCFARGAWASPPRPASAAEALVNSRMPSGSSPRRASPCCASAIAFWSEGKASRASCCRPSAASFPTAASLRDRKAFQKNGPWRVKDPVTPTAATRSRTPAATPSATIFWRERGADATFSRNPPCIRGWKGTGTFPADWGAGPGATSGASFIRWTDAANGPAEPMAIHSSTEAGETSSFPFNSPLPSISTISCSEKGPKTRPDGRRIR